MFSNLTKKQEELLYKEFRVNEYYTITRNDYESFPCAMIAFKWSDEKMQELADNIGRELEGCMEWHDGRNMGSEEWDEDFWSVMESTAVEMGMQYYEDLSKEEYDRVCKEWDDIK